MTIKKAISQLESLRADAMERIDPEDEDDVFSRDMEALGTAIVKLTDESQRTGKWEITDAYPHNVYCSECHKRCAQTHWAVWEDGSLPRNYCPNCGARMVKG